MRTTITLFLFLFFISFTLAAGGGTSYDTAELISPGNYSGTLEAGGTTYYKFEIKPGDKVLFKGTLSSNTVYIGYLNLVDQNEKTIFSGYASDFDDVTSIPANGVCDTENVLYSYGSANNSYNTYIVVLNMKDKPISYSFTFFIAKEERTDANEKDAGDSFESAIEISQGSYSGWIIGGQCGNDEKDFYKINLNKDEKITIDVTNSGEFYSTWAIFDEPHERASQASESVGPKETKTLSRINQKEARTVYFSVERTTDGGYNFDVNVEKVATESSGTGTQPSSQSGPAPSTKPAIPCLPSFIISALALFVFVNKSCSLL